jgi:hypothetical protein
MGKIVLPYIALVALLFACEGNIKPDDMTAKELKKVLALSNFIDLNLIKTNVEKDLILRVFEMPVTEQNDCFPESHGVCNYDYYLSVSQYDEYPDFNVFKIGRFGQIISYKWIREDKPDYVEIEILTYKYSSAALKYNKKLKNEEKRILLKIDVSGVTQSSV